MTAQAEITQRNHRRAVRFFWCLLIGATTVSLTGNVVHAVLPYLPHVIIQLGAAAVPPIALLAAVHGIALAVRAGASGRFTLGGQRGWGHRGRRIRSGRGGISVKSLANRILKNPISRSTVE
jgi:hypothetical protein